MMNIPSRDFWSAAILSVTLAAVILLLLAIYQSFIEPSRKRRIVSRRLNEGHQQYLRQVQILKEGSAETGWWLRLFRRLCGESRFAKLRIQMLQADFHQGPGILIMWSFYLSLIGFLAGTWLLKSSLLGILGCTLGVLPYFFMVRKRRIKTRQFEAQMPDAMELLARSLRAGHTLPGGIELLGQEMEDPIGKEMAAAYEEQQFGLSTSDALLHILDRVNSLDLRYFVGAVLIQQDTGGNLAELMENIARVIRSRLNFKSKVRSLTAMGRISTAIMIVVPILAFFVLMVVARDYEKVLLESNWGRTMLLLGVIFLFIGSFLLKRMIRAVES
jgi:tight adherence protein B